MKKGLDAPLVPITFIIFGIIGMIFAFKSGDIFQYFFPVTMIICSLIFLNTSLHGKYIIIKRTIKALEIPQNSRILDIGTGHGAVLVEVAKYLRKPGKVIGIDIWNKLDQSDNSKYNAQNNVNMMNLNDVAELENANMTTLPFKDGSFNYVIASLSIHNVKPKNKRKKALSEAIRVLKLNGYLIIIDIEHINEYKKFLIEKGFTNIKINKTGFNGLWGALPTRVLIAQK